MSSPSPVRFLGPEEIVARKVGEAARLKSAEPACVVRDRALRLRHLAADHPMRDFTVFMAAAQHGVLAAPRTECCGECGHYLKIVDMGEDARVEPVADDLATGALDLLVSETGLLRHGVHDGLLRGEPAGDTLEHQHAGAP
jgi:formate dehydrogenase maturation protein FdhE